MNRKKIERYLKSRGCTYLIDWKIDEFKRIMKEVNFSGEEIGYLKFKRSSNGRRYIQFHPGRCYID